MCYLILFFPLFFLSCQLVRFSQAPSSSSSVLSFPNSEACRTSGWKKRASWEAPGAINAFKADQDGKWVVVSTLPDADLPQSDLKKAHLIALREGKKVWDRVLSGPIKQLDLSSQGDLVVFSDYEGRVQALNALGEPLWTNSGYCRPLILNASRHVLCDHDDDADSEIAFDLWDWNGKEVFHYPISKDSLVLKVSADEQFLAVALEKGEVIGFKTSSFQVSHKPSPFLRVQVPGEVVQIEISDQGLMVGYREGGISGPPRLAWFDLLGSSQDLIHRGLKKKGIRTQKSSEKIKPKKIWELPFPPVQMVWAGSSLFFSHDSLESQFLGRLSPFSSDAGSSSLSLWKWDLESEFFQPLRVFDGVVYRGIEEPFQPYDLAKLGEWSPFLQSQEKAYRTICIGSTPGAYLYDFIRRGQKLFVATDDGVLHFFEQTPET